MRHHTLAVSADFGLAGTACGRGSIMAGPYRPVNEPSGSPHARTVDRYVRRVLRKLVLIAVAVTFAACGSNGHASGHSSGSSPPIATSAAPTTTAPTTTAAPTQPAASPAAAAAALIDAWRADDRTAASAIATPAAIQALFAAGTPSRVESRGCSDASFDPANCVYRTDLGEVQMRTTRSGAGWVVDQARVSPA